MQLYQLSEFSAILYTQSGHSKFEVKFQFSLISWKNAILSDHLLYTFPAWSGKCLGSLTSASAKPITEICRNNDADSFFLFFFFWKQPEASHGKITCLVAIGLMDIMRDSMHSFVQLAANYLNFQILPHLPYSLDLVCWHLFKRYHFGSDEVILACMW